MAGVKGLKICFYLGWSDSILQFRQNIIKVGSKSCLLTCSSNITLSLPSYTRAQNVCPGWPVYEVKQPQEKWACDFHDDAPPLSFQLQVAEVIF